jgi:hypothetical protein
MPNIDDLPWRLTIPFATEQDAREFVRTSGAQHCTIKIAASAQLHMLDPSHPRGQDPSARTALRCILIGGHMHGEVGPISWRLHDGHWLRIRIADYTRVANRRLPSAIAEAVGGEEMLTEVMGMLDPPAVLPDGG